MKQKIGTNRSNDLTFITGWIPPKATKRLARKIEKKLGIKKGTFKIQKGDAIVRGF